MPVPVCTHSVELSGELGQMFATRTFSLSHQPVGSTTPDRPLRARPGTVNTDVDPGHTLARRRFTFV